MSDKWKTEELHVGMTSEATFWANPVAESKFRYRATHLDGRRSPKVVLCDDTRVRPGVPCQVRVTAIRKPQRNDRGSIEVEFLRLLDFKLDGGYLDPLAAQDSGASRVSRALILPQRPFQVLAERNPPGFADVRKFVVSPAGQVLRY